MAISISIPSDCFANIAEEDGPEIIFSFGLNIEPEIVCCLDMRKNKSQHSLRNSGLTSYKHSTYFRRFGIDSEPEKHFRDWQGSGMLANVSIGL
ncbi:MAG: hypothetical protein WCH01_13225 [Methylococcaceae bacterium]